MDDPQIRRLIRWNRFFITVFVLEVLTGVMACGIGYVQFYVHQKTGVRTGWTNGNLRVYQLNGVTEVTGFFAPTPHSLIVTRLPEPRMIQDSGYLEFTRKDIAHWRWESEFGHKMPPPPAGSDIRALYFHPPISEFMKR